MGDKELLDWIDKTPGFNVTTFASGWHWWDGNTWRRGRKGSARQAIRAAMSHERKGEGGRKRTHP